MRGIVFTELLELVENKFGYETVDKVLQKAKPITSDAYTSVGSYPHRELVSILVELSQELDMSIGDLMELYGHHLFGVFGQRYSSLFIPGIDAFTFLASVEDHIHPEVLKLYPDAELPKFDIESKDHSELIMVYHSKRKMGDFALGLIKGCLEYFDEQADILMEKLNDDATTVRFTIRRRA
ncbi:heme NO-binding domain-containing protein [Marinoscillum pacificum]|uniref:heme NO-binding domain-containing protein n=1 Tax=Marinoscillum pacificum TaxID=392723 RepID=UPI002157CA1E|nr:heme NO-binding domain-containing protein [Marinoscillum pacificum]